MDVTFIGSSPGLGQRPLPILPEFAFIGRSNCGKSSLINYFFGRSGLARTSSKPGKTRLLNYFNVEDRYFVVDLPGYGYAKVSKQQRRVWWRLFEEILACQERPLAVFHLLDARRRPSADDCQVSRWIQEAGHPFALALTKIDKLGTNKRSRHFQEIVDVLAVPPTTPCFPTTAQKGSGRGEMLAWVNALLAENRA